MQKTFHFNSTFCYFFELYNESDGGATAAAAAKLDIYEWGWPLLQTPKNIRKKKKGNGCAVWEGKWEWEIGWRVAFRLERNKYLCGEQSLNTIGEGCLINIATTNAYHTQVSSQVEMPFSIVIVVAAAATVVSSILPFLHMNYERSQHPILYTMYSMDIDVYIKNLYYNTDTLCEHARTYQRW